MIDRLQQTQIKGQVSKLHRKAKVHQAQCAQKALYAQHYKALASNHAIAALSHQLLAQRRKLQASSSTDLQLNYELQAQYHSLQAEQHQECFVNYRLIAIDTEKKALAHHLLAEHLVNHIIPILTDTNLRSLPIHTTDVQRA